MFLQIESLLIMQSQVHNMLNTSLVFLLGQEHSSSDARRMIKFDGVSTRVVCFGGGHVIHRTNKEIICHFTPSSRTRP